MGLSWTNPFVPYLPTAGHPLRARSSRAVKGRTPPADPWGKVQGSGRVEPTARVEEWEQLTLELAQARERIAELTRAQVELTSTIARLTELASTDVLTGLNNRRRFNEALEANF